MNTMIIGATGFVGTYLTKALLRSNHRVTGVARSGRTKDGAADDRYRFLAADATRPGEWQQALSGMDAVVNLAGRSVFGRWSDAVKKEIRDSRILTTRRVVEALPETRPTVLVNASGVGYYGDRGEDTLSEEEPAGEGFLPRLVVEWESEALKASRKNCRVVMLRLGVVLGRGGGAMAQMIPAFKSFLGGPIGDGRQWFPWIHAADVVAAVQFALAQPEVNGALNCCAPEPARNRDLARALGKALNRPSALAAPAFMIRLALGEFGGMLLESQRAVPRKLLQHGFAFQFPDIASALKAVVGGE
jgi:uncharacterized protein (TIGR01777 family)